MSVSDKKLTEAQERALRQLPVQVTLTERSALCKRLDPRTHLPIAIIGGVKTNTLEILVDKGLAYKRYFGCDHTVYSDEPWPESAVESYEEKYP